VRLCVFCGSRSGTDPRFVREARAFGALLAREGIGVVYGGARVGMMGAVADAALEAGGEVIGVIPQALMQREIAHTGLSELRVVESMHQRKAMMAALADGFVALPGGAGTLEEIFEAWTWVQIGLHQKPCALLNTAGYYDGLVGFLDHAMRMELLDRVHREALIVAREAGELLAALRAYVPPPPRWVAPEELEPAAKGKG
jgi:uncharacterized protein (TIGR00730 family)